MTGNWGLIDRDTPQSAFTVPSYNNPKNELQLVFSDEFNVDGRSFYPGDDPYWEATDLHYWAVSISPKSCTFFHLIIFVRPTIWNGMTQPLSRQITGLSKLHYPKNRLMV